MFAAMYIVKEMRYAGRRPAKSEIDPIIVGAKPINIK
jgi:hypothetical protein